MALKAILLRHKIEAAEKNLEALRARSGELEKRETELTSALEEATAEGAQTSAEDMAILERDIDAHTAACRSGCRGVQTRPRRACGPKPQQS